MRVHDTLEPLRGLTANKRQLVESGRLIGDGGYSRVIAYNAYSVLKLTCCAQTRALLDRLRKTTRSRYPRALPAVLDYWGPVAKDADGIRFFGYVLERLYPEDSVAERLRGKRLGLGVIAQHREAATTPYQVRLAELHELQDCLAAAKERCLLGERPAPQEHLAMAEQLAVLRLPGQLESTFDFLADFLRDTQGETDLFQGGNILLDCTGKPMLADPVAEVTGLSAETLLGAPELDTFALVAQTVLRLDGLHAELTWDTLSLSSDKEALQEDQQALLTQPGKVVEARVLPHSGPEHKALIAQGRTRLETWRLPASVRREASRLS